MRARPRRRRDSARLILSSSDEAPVGAELGDHARREVLRTAQLHQTRRGVRGGERCLGRRAFGTVEPGESRSAKPPPPPPGSGSWHAEKSERYGVSDALTPFESATTYNNYYELGLDKGTPSRLGHLIKPRPWTVRITGEVERALELDLDTMVGWFGLEERVYRMRCVEAWSMVIPWLGFPLEKLVRRVNPSSRAKYVVFRTLHDPAQLPNQESQILPWPYQEGLRIDEAANPLALLAVGLYGGMLPGQNGAPLRLVVPWKYGFKGGKSLVEIAFVEKRPETTWNRAAPREYGFFANVNPNVSHPRWSQARERRIGEFDRRPTLMCNGYGDWVAAIYSGLDLRGEFLSDHGVTPSGRRHRASHRWLNPAIVAVFVLALRRDRAARGRRLASAQTR